MSRALIIVDVQNDFCEGGSLPVGGGASVAAAISAAISAAIEEEVASANLVEPTGVAQSATPAEPTNPAQSGRWDHVVATKDHHLDPGDHFHETPDFVDSWPEHCVVGSPGADFHPELDTDRIEAVFEKGANEAAYSGFEGQAGGIGLAAWLRMRDVDEVEVVGIATDHCVRATALDAVREGFKTTVKLNLTAGVARETTEAALIELREAGVKLVGTPVLAG